MSNYTIPTPKDRMMFVDVTPNGKEVLGYILQAVH